MTTELLIPLGIIWAVLTYMALYILVVAVRKLSTQLVKVNEQLLIMVAAKEGKAEVIKALVATSKQPVKKLDGIASNAGQKKPDGKAGITMTMGSM